MAAGAAVPGVEEGAEVTDAAEEEEEEVAPAPLELEEQEAPVSGGDEDTAGGGPGGGAGLGSGGGSGSNNMKQRGSFLQKQRLVEALGDTGVLPAPVRFFCEALLALDDIVFFFARVFCGFFRLAELRGDLEVVEAAAHVRDMVEEVNERLIALGRAVVKIEERRFRVTEDRLYSTLMQQLQGAASAQSPERVGALLRAFR